MNKKYIIGLVIGCVLLVILLIINKKVNNNAIVYQNTHLPELQLPPLTINNDYKYDFSIVLCGCAKNIEKYIYKSLDKLKEIQKLFKESYIIIYENNSTDNTLKILKDFEMNNDNVLIITENKYNHYRTIRLARGRNILLKHIFKINPDYFLMLDLDDVVLNINIIEKLKYCFESKIDWSVLSIYSKNYYDHWALRTYEDSNNMFEKNIIGIRKYSDVSTINHQLINKMNNNEYLKVISSFNGVCLYKTQYCKNCCYDGYNTESKFIFDIEDCEHVKFHTDIIKKNNGNIYIIKI